jgi:hypothetical protein
MIKGNEPHGLNFSGLKDFLKVNRKIFSQTKTPGSAKEEAAGDKKKLRIKNFLIRTVPFHVPRL